MTGLVIIGGGLAGAKAAEGARAGGFDGPIVLVGEEPHAPYERPPLSKGVLRGEAEPASAAVHDDGWYAEHAVEVRTGARATALDLDARRVVLDDGDVLPFDGVVLATGATPRRLSVPGAALDGVFHLRTVDDAVALREAIRGAERVAVVGAGWIGTEVAASAREMGADVVLVDPAPVPLHRVLGSTVGALFADLHRGHGVALRLGVGVVSLRGDGRVREVVLEDGSVEGADVVVAGIGVVPDVALATAAGLAVDDGIVVDRHLATAVPGVHAAGDVARAFHPRYDRHLRVEHWSSALHQGATAGRNATGGTETYDRLPYFFSDQYDLGMEYVGLGDPGDDVVFRGDVEDRKVVAFWVREGRVTAAMNVNVWDVGDELRAIVESDEPVDVGALADPSVPLADLP